MHYTGWLMPMAIFGAIYTISMCTEGVGRGKKFEKILESPTGFFSGVAAVVWVSLFAESWKRKQNIIANEWLVRNF